MCESYCCPYRKIVCCSLVHREFAWIKKGFLLRLAYASYIIYIRWRKQQTAREEQA